MPRTQKYKCRTCKRIDEFELSPTAEEQGTVYIIACRHCGTQNRVEVEVMPETFKCPACGSDDVIADVTAWYREVPVHQDGYHPPDGKPDGDDLQHLRCGACDTGLRIIDWEEGEIKRALPEPKAVRFKIEEAIGWTPQQADYLRGELIERAVDEVGRPPFGEEFEEWVGEVRVTDFHFLVILHPEPPVERS